MRIKEIIAISGMSGLYKSEAQKVNGVIVTSLTEGWTKFISNRQNLFSPLENVSIYTDGDTIDLADVLIEVYNQSSTNPPVLPTASNEEIRNWFFKIVPNHDAEKVYISDIKKLVKWYGILRDKGIIEDEIKAREAEAAEKETRKENVQVDEIRNQPDNESTVTDVPEGANETKEKKKTKAGVKKPEKNAETAEEKPVKKKPKKTNPES